jgi:hypothetical protein
METMETCNDHIWMSLIHLLVRYGYRPYFIFRALHESHLLVKLYNPHLQDWYQPLDIAQVGDDSPLIGILRSVAFRHLYEHVLLALS